MLISSTEEGFALTKAPTPFRPRQRSAVNAAPKDGWQLATPAFIFKAAFDAENTLICRDSKIRRKRG